MAEYHFVSIWQINAPIERVWEEIHHAERWPSWWKYVTGVDELEAGYLIAAFVVSTADRGLTTASDGAGRLSKSPA